MTKTKTQTRMSTVLYFEKNGKEFAVIVSTDGTGDCFEDIWTDICSYLLNVQEAENSFEECLEATFKYYPDYEYEIQSAA